MLDHEIAEWQVGDEVVTEAHRVGEGTRVGEVVEVIDRNDHPRCRVRWEDGHETVVYPGTDVRRVVRDQPKE